MNHSIRSSASPDRELYPRGGLVPSRWEPEACESLEPRVMLEASVISIRATDKLAAESTGRPNPAAIVIERSGRDLSAGLEVGYAVGGTAAESDFLALPGHATIPAGKKSIVIPILALEDAVAEDSETVTMNLLASDAYTLNPNAAKRAATVTIADNEPAVSIIRTKDASEGKAVPIDGVFTVKRAGADTGTSLRVEYSLATGSTATDGADFRSLAGFVEIPAGKRDAKIIISPVADLRAERPESVQLVLNAVDRYRIDAKKPSAVLTIADVTRVDLLSILRWDQDGQWRYALTSDSVFDGQGTHATATATGTIDTADSTSVWSMTVADVIGPSDAVFILPTTTYERREDGVYLTQIANSISGSTGSATNTLIGLRLTPPTLQGIATGRGTSTVSTAFGDLHGSASSKVTLGSVEAVTVPAGTFDATRITMTMQLRGSGRVTVWGQTASVTYSQTVTITFWAVEDVGPIKIAQVVSGAVSGAGDSLRFKGTAVGLMLEPQG